MSIRTAVIKPAAVNGTQEILRFACTSATKPIHYISTNGIFAGEVQETYLENSDIDSYADHLTNGYGQAKWVAEKLVWEAVSRGLPVCLYRPGNIGHHSVTGVTNPSDFQSMIVDACAQVDCAPDMRQLGFRTNSGRLFGEIHCSFCKQSLQFRPGIQYCAERSNAGQSGI